MVTKQRQADRKACQEFISDPEKSRGSRTRLSNLQEKIKYQINAELGSVEDNKIKRKLAELNSLFDEVVELKEKLAKAQKTRKNLYEHYLAFNKALFDLAAREIGILTSIEAGYQVAEDAERKAVIDKINQRAAIEREYEERINIPVERMTPAQKEAWTEDRRKAKAEMLARIKELDIKGQRFGSLAEVRAAKSKIALLRRSLNAWVEKSYPLKEAGKGLSALETLEAVERMQKEKARYQADTV